MSFNSSNTIPGTSLSKNEIKRLNNDSKIDIMRSWFHEHFSDPVENTPYESSEGGYIYIWGGPYDAYEELSVFSDIINDDLIQELSKELSEECLEWTGREQPADYFEDIVFDNEDDDNITINTFNQSIDNINEIINSPFPNKSKNHLYGLLHISVITSIEAYLLDKFLIQVFLNDDNIQSFIKNEASISKEKINISNIYEEMSNLNSKIKTRIQSISWHNIATANNLYQNTLNIDFPKDIGSLYVSVQTRHHLVHRNGRDQEGNLIVITKENIINLIDVAKKLINSIENQILEQSPF